MAATPARPTTKTGTARQVERPITVAAPRARGDRLSWATLIGLCGFLGITAAAGGIGLLTGWIAPGEEMLESSPFGSYVIPGVVLLLVVGGSGLMATLALLRRSAMAGPAAAFAGLMIIGFEIVEYAVIGFHWLQVAYVAVGVLIIALAGLLARRPTLSR
jgi:hypothetical protein